MGRPDKNDLVVGSMQNRGIYKEAYFKKTVIKLKEGDS